MSYNDIQGILKSKADLGLLAFLIKADNNNDVLYEGKARKIQIHLSLNLHLMEFSPGQTLPIESFQNT